MNETMKRTKASFGVGKSMTKHKGIIAQSAQHNRIHSLNRTVLINERSIKIGGDIGVVKGHQMIITNRNKIIPKKGVTNHPRAERSGNSLVVGRLQL